LRLDVALPGGVAAAVDGAGGREAGRAGLQVELLELQRVGAQQRVELQRHRRRGDGVLRGRQRRRVA